MTDSSFDVLLFDLGGVLVDFAGFAELPKLLREPISFAEVKRRWISSPAVSEFERGGFTPEEFAAAFAAEWPLNLYPAEFLVAFEQWLRGFYPGALELLADLRDEYRLACFSNSNPLHWHRNQSLLGIGEVFDRTYASHQMGTLKPQRAAFEHVIADLAVPPGRIAFFDDTPVNVEAAAALGVHAFAVAGVPALREALVGLGILRGRPRVR